MAIEKSTIVAFFDSIEALEDNKKEIAKEIKDSFEAFAVNNEVNKKAVMKAYKDYQACKKDQQEFVEVDFESDNILNIAIPEVFN